jgi:hypothetical protein
MNNGTQKISDQKINNINCFKAGVISGEEIQKIPSSSEEIF